MESRLVLYGASGHCKVIIDIIESLLLKVDLIIDDNRNVDLLCGRSVVSTKEATLSKNDSLIISIGNNSARKNIAKGLDSNFLSVVHARAIVSKNIEFGLGNVVMPLATINSGAKIGSHCIINTNSIVEHDCIIGDFVHISPRASLAGNVQVGEGTQIGIGAVVIQNIKIGKWAMIGAGSIIISDVPDYAVVVGNPGRIIKYNNND
ncbi:acetyltransferase [Flavobacterium aquatile]|uniref:Acetyltransferase n=1 Tax=Flavobacterium aquatile LMG 4008 = ATCC 11947 TaxID=1453498 RepID=A0A095TZ31_9FLAO|nr:acetyltransferase [Flavobacterium aquatile]KGD67603.1 acetyltransferase [Flavobacterium aquatile LMG 4008 = ATCC 11947]OXA67470.1 acetyltransferase [Flavobacterium aquatile] [Flavobacterium aquatile LMG 4008 = ATCC 11947]GEC79202.1 acetyltransferase [Flavobacterium aquatile]